MILNTDLKYSINLCAKSIRHIHWEFCDTSNLKLYSKQRKQTAQRRTLSPGRSDFSQNSKLTHSYLPNRELQPECNSRDCPVTIHDIIYNVVILLPYEVDILINNQCMKILQILTIILRYILHNTNTYIHGMLYTCLHNLNFFCPSDGT